VGGGAAGMEAALVAAERGHQVVLFAKDGKLGGHLVVASGPSFKGDMKRYCDYMLRRIESSGVDVRLGTAATREKVEAERPDEVIIAAGAEPVWPDIPGLRAPDGSLAANVVPVSDVFASSARVGERVVVVGAGGMGLEAALKLAEEGKQVAIIDLPGGSEQDQTVNFVDMIMLLELLEGHGLRVREGVVPESVSSGVVRTVNREGQGGELAADTVVVAAKMKPRSDVIEQLSGVVDEPRVVGDCKAPRILFNAVHEGFEAALEI
jgi:NADPH-dependent 2,4-dienoyl-CoA reductase/sulfur reductase-like enzyme